MKNHETTLFYRDWASSSDVSDFQPVGLQDGVARHSPDSGISIDSTTYTKTTPQGPLGREDTVKWLVYYRESFPVNNDETVYEVSISASQCFNQKQPIPLEFVSRVRNIYEDYRLCCSGIVVTDVVTGMTFMVLVTNDAIYGVQEVKHEFTSTFLLCKKGSSDVVRVGIGIHGRTRCVKYYVEGVDMYTIPIYGKRLSDQHQVLNLSPVHTTLRPPLTIESVSVGFGHFTYWLSHTEVVFWTDYTWFY
jgi:hypothetical protein